MTRDCHFRGALCPPRPVGVALFRGTTESKLYAVCHLPSQAEPGDAACKALLSGFFIFAMWRGSNYMKTFHCYSYMNMQEKVGHRCGVEGERTIRKTVYVQNYHRILLNSSQIFLYTISYSWSQMNQMVRLCDPNSSINIQLFH